MFEDLYNYCTQLIWVTFRRHDFDQIQIEVGNMLRSPVYNPALRTKQSELQENECNVRHYRPGRIAITLQISAYPDDVM